METVGIRIVGMVRFSELLDSQTVDLSKMSDKLIGTVRMLRFKYAVENALIRII